MGWQFVACLCVLSPADTRVHHFLVLVCTNCAHIQQHNCAHIQQQPGRETRRARLSPFRIEESKLRWRARNIILTCFFFVHRVINLVSEEAVVRQSLGVCHYKLILMNDNY